MTAESETDTLQRRVEHQRSVLRSFIESFDRIDPPLRDVRREYLAALPWLASIEAAALALLIGVGVCGCALWQGAQLMDTEVSRLDGRAAGRRRWTCDPPEKSPALKPRGILRFSFEDDLAITASQSECPHSRRC